MDYITLNTGAQMPMNGFGVFRVPDLKECEDSVYEAIRIGYRLIDTATADEMATISSHDMGYSGSRAKHFEPSFVRMVLGKGE